MPPAPATSEMLSEMSACAYRLGMAFGQEAERTQDRAQRLELFHLFDRCFFAVRVATALQLRLKREAPERREPAGETLRDTAETERPEADDAAEPGRERLDDGQDRDRDRETERASLPVFFKTLEGVTAGAAALPGPKPAELPTLQDLLARATTEPAKPTVAPLRNRLSGSAALAVAAPALRPSPSLPPRRATGPPRR